MKKRLSREEKNQQAIIDITDKMFEIAGHNVTYDDIKNRTDDWYHDWTMTLDQQEEWKKWGKKYLIKNLRMYSKMAEEQMNWVSLMWGLKLRKEG